MEDKQIKSGQDRKVEELHWDSQRWKSNLQLMEDELVFIDRLLNSYVFEPNTPNLFERLQDYKERLKKAKAGKKRVRESISRHEVNLGGMLECADNTCDKEYYQKHDLLTAEVLLCLDNFQNLKWEIFNYAGGILKKRKPKKQ